MLPPFLMQSQPANQRWRALGAGVSMLILTACASKDAPEPGHFDAAVSDGPDVFDAASHTDVEPSTFGLAARPINASCVAPANSSLIAERLSMTGCFEPNNPSKPGPGLIPYDVASPLWSDGARKERFFALPQGKQLKLNERDPNHVEVPVGAILVKTFGFAGRLHETRLLVKFKADLWKGYSYKWRDDQSDADLLADNVEGETSGVSDEMGKEIDWHYPSRAECLQCHNDAALVSLGLELRQLNRDFEYPSGIKSNQLATFAHIGLFEQPLPQPLPAAYVDPYGASGSVEDKARSYLQVNCALCHRPLSNFDEFDLRYDTQVAASSTCNVPPSKGDLNIAGAMRIVPGLPGKSVMTLRMKTTDETRMPQIGSNVVDVVGVELLEAWISSLQACPN